MWQFADFRISEERGGMHLDVTKPQHSRCRLHLWKAESIANNCACMYTTVQTSSLLIWST